MRTVPALRAMLTAAAVTAAVAGCGANVDGDTRTESTATTSSDAAPLFNPCSDLPDHVLEQVGLNPSTKDTVTDPPTGPSSWRVCGWQPDDKQFEITVFSTRHTLEESQSKDDLVGFKDVAIGPRQGMTYHDKSGTADEHCYAAFPAAHGMFEIAAEWTLDSARDRDICSVAIEYAAALEPHLPT